MGEFTWPISVWSADRQRRETVEALVDTGATYSLFPAAMLRRLDIAPTDREQFEQADGRIVAWDTADALVSVNGRQLIRRVIFGNGGAEAIIGADTLQGFRLLVDSHDHRLIERVGRLK